MSDSGPLLTLITFMPLLGMLVILFIPSKQKEWIKTISLIFTLPFIGARCENAAGIRSGRGVSIY